MAMDLDVADPFKSPAGAGGGLDVADPFAITRPDAAAAAPAKVARPKSSVLRRTVGDTAVDLGRGVIGAGEALVGLANIPTLGAAGKGLEAIGYDPGTSKDMIGELYSPERKAAQEKVEQASGFTGTAMAMLRNPSTIAGTVFESAPSILGGGAIAQGLKGVRGLGALARAGIGEGAVAGGQSAEEIRQQTDTGLLTPGQAGAAVASGVGTGVLGVAGGRLAQRLGIGDVDVMLAGGATRTGDVAKPMLRRTVEGAARGAVTEGVFEELPQSMQEQAWQNVALDRPVSEGVPEAAAAGLLSGMAMGGPIGAVSSARVRQPSPGSLEEAAGGVAAPAPRLRRPDAAPGSMADAASALPDTPAPPPANAGMFERMLDEQGRAAGQPRPARGDEAGNAAYEDRDVSTGVPEPAAPKAPPINLDPATGEELGIDAGAWPSAAEHQQPAAIVQALKTGAARNKNRPDGVTRIAETYNVSRDTARALRNRAIAEMQAEAGSPRRADGSTAETATKAGEAAADAAPASAPDAGAQPQARAALASAPAGREAAAVEGEASAQAQAPEGDAADGTPATNEQAVYDTTEEMLDSDVGAPSGGPFTINDAAQRVAARTEGGRVFPVDGGFVVRTPQSAAEATPAQEPESELRQPSLGDRSVPGESDTAPAVLAQSAQEDAQSKQTAPQDGAGQAAESEALPTGMAQSAQPRPAKTQGQGAADGTGSLPSAQATPAAPAAQSDPKAIVEVKDRYGVTHRVRQGDLAGDRTQLRLYNRNGTPKIGNQSSIHRDNIDLTGDLRAEQIAQDANNALTAVVTNKNGGAFKTPAAARAHATKNGYAETHEVQPAASGSGFVLLRKPPAAPAEQLAERANEAATSPQNGKPLPTDAQKEAGNYAKGHIRLNGHDISVENPAGSKRNPKWPKLKDHYGYIRGTIGKDKDHVDVFMTENAHDAARPVFVVDQVNKDGTLDEHKVIMGAADEAEARATYLRNYSKGWTGLGAITEMSQDEFKAWVRDPKKTARPAGKLAKPARGAEPGPAPAARAPAAEPAAEYDSPSIDSAEVSVARSLRRIADEVEQQATGGGRRPLDVRWTPGAIKRSIAASGMFAGRVSGPLASAKIAVSKANTPADLRKVAEKLEATVSTAETAPASETESTPAPATPAPTAGPAPARADKIDDLGEKVGGARKDTSGGRKAKAAAKPHYAVAPSRVAGQWLIRDKNGKHVSAEGRFMSEADAAARVDVLNAAYAAAKAEGPAWRKRYAVVSNETGEIGRKPWKIIDTKTGRSLRGTEADTQAEAEANIPLAVVAIKHRVSQDAGGKFAIWRQVTDRKRVKVVQKDFDTRDEAMRYMAENAAAIIETNTRYGEEHLARPDTVERRGPQRREGDVKGDDFMATFGFRGVEFGNWNAQDERQTVMNHAYDGLLDLAEVLNIPPRAISLNGELALAFGARGHGLSGARAHYELDKGVINLTKMKGAGALAHEWLHALDAYFGRQAGRAPAPKREADGTLSFGDKGPLGMLSHGPARPGSGIRRALERRYDELVRSMFKKAEQYVEDTEKAQQFVGRTHEAVASRLQSLRDSIATERQYGAKKKPATAAQLAEFDKHAAAILGGPQSFEWREMGKPRGRLAVAKGRHTNDALEGLSAVLKAVTGRSGFAEHGGPLDRLRTEARHHADRLKMLASAEQSETKTRGVPTSFAMEAKKIDQGAVSDYWTTPHEMAARAFSAYVEDKVAATEGVSDFLSFGSNNELPVYRMFGIRPFPEGQEREALNKLFDDFFAEVRTEQTETGSVRLFSKPPADQATDSTFFSALLRAVETAKGAPRRGGTLAWKQWLDGAQRRGELKQEERDWLGVDAWLEGQESITRDQVMQYVRANQVQVQEVELGDPSTATAQRHADVMALFDKKHPEATVEAREDAAYDTQEWLNGSIETSDLARALGLELDALRAVKKRGGGAKFGDYQLPGGTNYRELLLTLPVELDPADVAEVRALAAAGKWEDAARKEANARRKASFINKTHYDQPNIVAHVRFNERTDADGKRVLFLEEVQSDWHQRGRRDGYRGQERPEGASKVWKEVPDAPFKTTWPMLTFRRMLRYAADHGYERIAWTTGQQQFDRYPEGSDEAKAARLNGMEGFYDRVLPNEVNKLVKRFGTKVGRTNVPAASEYATTFDPTSAEVVERGGVFQVWVDGRLHGGNFDSREAADSFAQSGGGTAVHSVDITPDLRRAALGGQPLFSATRGAQGSAPLTFDRALRLKAELTGQWGENAPTVVLVETAEGFPEFAKADPDYRRAEGLWGGKKAIWINVGGIATEKRFAEVLAHEAIGHFGVENIVGAEQWTGIVAAIANHDRNGTGAESLQRAMKDVQRRYGDLDASTFAKEVIAVMAEQGARNGLVDRVIAAVRQFLRRIMPAMDWSSADVVALLAQAESHLRAGRSQADRRQAVAELAFSRRGWGSFPSAVLGHGAGVVSAHPDYEAAKAGDDAAALRLAKDMVSDRYVDALRAALPAGAKPTIVPVLAQEDAGRNKIPALVAEVLGQRLGLPAADNILQAQRVSRGGSDGFHRLANQPRFTGEVAPGDYLILDDTLAQGGTLAELKTHIEDNGGRVLLATALTGKAYSATMAPSDEQLRRLRERFADLEPWWRDTFGHGFDGFTASEARFLLKLKGRPGSDAIRARVDAARVRAVDGVGEGATADRSGTEAPGPGRGTEPPVGGIFSLAPRVETDAFGNRTIHVGGETFAEFGTRYYLTDKAGRLRDFRALDTARAEADRIGAEVRIDQPVEGEPQTFSVVLPEAMARAAGAPQPLFSKAPTDVLDDIDAVMSDSHREGMFARAKQWLKDATPKKIKDELRGTWLGALTTRHLIELGQDYFSNIHHYSDYLAAQAADRNKLQTDAEAIAEGARKWAGKNRREARALFDLMHQATIDGVDPSKEFQPLQFQYGGAKYEATPKNVKDTLRAIREQMLGRSGDNKKDMMAEAKMIREMPARDRRRRKKYPSLVAAWNAMSPEAQEIYRQFRDTYAARSDAVEEALVARIEDTDAPDNHKRSLINTIRMQFETQRMQGVYFPLQRFGRYFVAAEKGDTSTFLMFEKLGELERAVAGLKERGFRITAQGLKNAGKAQDAPSGTFVADVIEKLRKAGVSDQTQDQIYQMYLQALPEMSMRKHAIHRKSVPGFDPDAVRAFAFNMTHGAHQLARLRYGHKMQNVLELLKSQQDLSRRQEDADTRKIAAGDAILEELNKRHEWINNPQDSNVTNLVSSFGFAWYLGATPAAALVNLSQTPMISYPYLAARYGGVKAMNALLKGLRDAGRTFGNIQRTLTDPEEARAHEVLQAMGAIDKTQAHNLAGIAEGGLVGYSPGWARTMEVIGWAFHRAEVVNREATGMAAFRLARAAGENFDAAIKVASDTIWDTHYDYSNANRARFMQSGTAKVLLMFRQYSLNTTWHVARMVWQATKAESPEVRRMARRNLAGLMGMVSVFAGVLGLPMAKATMGVLNAVAASFGDDDEPWDAETEFRAWLSGMVGREAAEAMLTGPTNALTGADIHSRVSLSDMWIRDADRELDGRGYYYHLLEQAAGPMGGVLKNVLMGKSLIDEGQVWRGIETMLPKALKDSMKSIRYAREGVNNLRGDPVLEDPSLMQALMQAQGFTPTQVARQYETNRSLKNYEQHILDRRRHLLGAIAMSIRLEDPKARASTMQKIEAFNRAHPELGITPKTIRQSMRSRERYSARAESGIVLNPKLAAKLRGQVGVDQ